MRLVDAEQVYALGPVAAAQALVAALQSGLDPAAGPARIPVDFASGQLLLMPAHDGVAAGVKVVTVAPGNPARGLPRIQAAYLLFDSQTLTLQAFIDGTALTTLRTPAVTMAAISTRLPDRPLHVVIAGTGPQGIGHAQALAAHREVARLTYLVRGAPRAEPPAAQAVLGSQQAQVALAEADVVVAATSARAPFFDSRLLRPDVVVAAVGSHEPQARELDDYLMARASVVVEDVATAMREAGDVVLAVQSGALHLDQLVPLSAVVRGEVDLPADRPLVVKTVGMPWEDLVVAQACLAVGSG